MQLRVCGQVELAEQNEEKENQDDYKDGKKTILNSKL